MFVYLASPIDQAGESSFLGSLRIAIEQKLAEAEIGVYRPHLSYSANPGNSDHCLFIDKMNEEAILRADALVAILPAGLATLGTPVEIERALAYGMPVVLFTDIAGSVQVAAWESRGVIAFDLDTETRLPDASDLRTWLTRDADSGKLPLLDPDLPVTYDPGSLPLTRAHHTDAGLDLATTDSVFTLVRGQRTLLSTGIRVSIPNGWYGRITGRSSALSRWNIRVHEGIIDAGYTGELKIGATFLGPDLSMVTSPNMRLAQLILAPVWNGNPVPVVELPSGLRGDNGWGSSGV